MLSAQLMIILDMTEASLSLAFSQLRDRRHDDSPDPGQGRAGAIRLRVLPYAWRSALFALGSDSLIDPVSDAPEHAQLVWLADATVG
jgi:hypothetical protein